MDLLHKRYASPYSILDQYIQFGGFDEYIKFIVKQQDEELLWELYLHSMSDVSFEAWKAEINKKENVEKKEIKKKSLKDTIAESEDILFHFSPEGV
jgi:hypothetical protein